MADNYLEKRYEEVFGAGASRKGPVKHASPSLNTLLVKNRTVRRYRQDFNVTDAQLRTIVEVNTKIASAMNRQALRFRLVPTENTARVESLKKCLFREPARSEAATAFIVIYTAVHEDRFIDIDLGISLQSMSLKAAELGLNCLIKGNIDKSALKSMFCEDTRSELHGESVDSAALQPVGSRVACCLEPLAVLCVGKAGESVFLKPVEQSRLQSQADVTSDNPGISENNNPRTAPDLSPYTKDGVHYVPKLSVDDIVI